MIDKLSIKSQMSAEKCEFWELERKQKVVAKFGESIDDQSDCANCKSSPVEVWAALDAGGDWIGLCVNCIRVGMLAMLATGCLNPTSLNQPARAAQVSAVPTVQTVTITNWLPAPQFTDKAGRLWFREREQILTNEVANVTDSLGQRHSTLLLQRGGETGRSRLTPAMASGTQSNAMQSYYSQPRRGELPQLPP